MESMEINTVPVEETVIAPPKPVAKAVAPPDKHIWGIYIFLVLISIVELYSASSREVASSSMGVLGPVFRHLLMLVAGCCIMLGLQRIHYAKLMGWVHIFAFISAAMMVYVMVAGDVVNGARRSFSLLRITIQPSEFLKLAAVLVIAKYTARHMEANGGVRNSGIIFQAALVLMFGGLLIQQGMTNTILLMGISLSMMLISGIQIKKIAVVLGVYGVFAAMGMLYHIASDDKATPAHQEAQVEQVVASTGEPVEQSSGLFGRFGTWGSRLSRHFNPVPPYQQELNAKNRQEQYAYMAQANGGVFGVFPGNSRETARLPLAFSDYIYAIIIEDMGLIGGLFVIVLYLWLLGRAAAITFTTKHALPALLVLGLAVMIVFQALFHMAIVSGFFPVSGQPLPLISKGGTSILITSIAFGIMLSVSRFAARKKTAAEDSNALPEDMNAKNPSML